MNPILAPILKMGEAIAVWLNPERKEKAVLRRAIFAAKQIIDLLEKTGEFKFYSDIKRQQLIAHYKKQLKAWEDGAS
jgi:hypothetical protein